MHELPRSANTGATNSMVTEPGAMKAGPTSPGAGSGLLASASGLADLMGASVSGSPPAVRAAAAAPASLALPHAGWEPVLSERVAWQIGERIQAARVELNPPDLGLLEVHVRFEGEQARVHLIAEAPATRDALEHGLPRLRELLHDSGVDLIDVSVGRHGRGERQLADAPGLPRWADRSDPPVQAVEAQLLGPTGLVDCYI